MANPCTPNAVQAIYNDQLVAAPILQVLNTKAIIQGGGTRYRALFSDGSYVIQGILANTLNAVVESGAMPKNSLIKLQKYSIKPISGRKLVLAVECDVLDQFGGMERIGSPIPIEGDGGAHQAQEGAREAPQQQQQQQGNPFQQHPHQQQQQQQQQQQHHQAEITTPSGGPVFPISSLNPYQNRWTIMARVTQKSDIKTWSKQGGNEGKLFSMTLMDDSGEIKATAFTQQVDEYYQMIEEGKVYFISNAKVDMAKKQFSNIKNDYELIIQRDTQINLAPDNNHVPAMRYKFVELSALANINEKETVDVVAIVSNVGDVTNNISQKTNRPVIKRDLTLVDATGFSTRLTLWGAQAESFTMSGSNAVIAFKGVTVSNYGGKSLNAFGGSTFKLNPEITEAFKLRAWFDQQGQSLTFQAHASDHQAGAAPRMTLDELKSASANISTEQLHFEVKGMIVMMSKSDQTFMYPACPTLNCSKKVTEDGGQWRCEKCNQTHPEPEYRYIMGVNVSDHTGQNWLQAFNDAGAIITGRPAQELALNPHEVKPTFDKATFKSYIFRGRAKQEVYGEEAKIRFTIISATPLKWADESKHLLTKLQEYGV